MIQLPAFTAFCLFGDLLNIKAKRTAPRRCCVCLRRTTLAAFTALLLGSATSAPLPAAAGGAATGGATEWTQLANNFELASLVGVEGRNLGINTQSLLNEVRQLATQIQTYQAILQNLERLPENYLQEALGPVRELHRIMGQARAIAASGETLDQFLRSDLITNPLFEGEGLEDAQISERYDAWLGVWDGALEVGLRQVGLTLDDVTSEAQLLDRINGQFGGVDGHLKALQISNELTGSVARQLVDLRALNATQAQQNTAAWSRVLADLDRKEAAQRKTDVLIRETIESYEGESDRRTIHDILGIGQ